jgi:hypothetical protein
MAITVTTTPVTLSWSNFRTVPTLVDPADGQVIDAYTAFDFNFPSRPPRTVNGQFALADPLVITITPNCQFRSGATQTAALLSHEQFHYDVGTVTARALARHLMALRASTVPALASAMRAAVTLHFVTRTGLIQRRYDKDTRHGTVARYQRIWKRRMATCLGNPRAQQLGGFWL